ncbi:hypothetical protein fugu_017425 [Takifugu bimaculatus]|uniref:Uncharacterized protein n=1 Tax=Takifugu bimaculatus TaxID=433685 RepID=A0A4Z2BSW1_9TELE|nr:hypothetical protein fugu_017425 [Takifugu bimaculatus]
MKSTAKVHEMDPVRGIRHTCTFDLHTNKHHELCDGADRVSPGFGKCSGFSAKCARVQCHVSVQTHTAEMPRCFSGDVHRRSQESRGGTLCSHCSSSSLRLKEGRTRRRSFGTVLFSAACGASHVS